MDILCSREVDNDSDIKQDMIRACLNGYDNGSDGNNRSDGERGHQRKLYQKILAKSASFPSAAMSPSEDDEIGTALRRIFCEDSIHSSYTRSIYLLTSMKLVSALKGSREKLGLSPDKLTVTWAPDVYDPLPTSVLHTVRGKKQQKSRKKNDRKKNGKKGQKGNSSSRGKDIKQFRKVCGSSDRCHKPLEIQDRVVVNTSGDLDGFGIGNGSTDSYCGNSFLNKSPTTTRMLYSLAEAL